MFLVFEEFVCLFCVCLCVHVCMYLQPVSALYSALLFLLICQITNASGSQGDRVFSGFCLSVCLYICHSICFSARYLKNRCNSDHQTWHGNVPPWVLASYSLLQVVRTTYDKTSSLRQASQLRYDLSILRPFLNSTPGVETHLVPEWVFALLWVPASSS